ncbi:MAG: hypothetical protein HC877_20490 [Thioploca sp.]|nr:hypothetical protein [Thioploca sp.]
MDDKPCSWTGIICSNQGHVIGISLKSNNLIGNLPPELGNLTNLQKLYLNDNQLSGNLPPEWAQLTNLRTLYLDNNQLSGAITSNFTQLEKISRFYVNYNMLTAADSTIATFISEHGDSNWQATQTLPPTDINAVALSNQSVLVSWTPILYQKHSGYYEVGVATTVGGPYVFQRVAGDKTANTHIVTNLLPSTTYYLVVRTYTPKHGVQRNDLTSDLSTEISTENIPLSSICRLQTQLPEIECEALMALYNSTNGQNWTKDWYENDKLCSWSGVTCSEGHVIGIFLTRNNLIGSLPPELSNLTNLQWLYLTQNQLSGNLPPEWGNLVNLERLFLNINQLSGNLPPEWGKMASLQHITVGSNQLSGNLPSEWGQLANLQRLNLYNNQLSGNLPPQWSQLINLQGFGLWSNQLSGNLPPQWGQLINLQDLDLYNNQLSGSLPPEWGNLVNLQNLLLNNNQLSGNLPPEWSKLANLQVLRLQNNQLSGVISSDFIELKKISQFYVNYNMFTAADFTTAVFISEHGYSNWQATQTLPPTEISAAALSSQSIQINWTPILYQNHGGYYEVGVATTAGGPYIFQPVAGDKTATTHIVTGLLPKTTYYLVVRTYTPAHPEDGQQNNLTSDLSVEVSTKTAASLLAEDDVSNFPAGIDYSEDYRDRYASSTTVTLAATADSCEPAVYLVETQQLTFPVLAIEMYSPLTNMPHDEYVLCSREDHAPISLEYDSEQQGLLFANGQEISCAAQLIKPHDTCFPVYSAQLNTLELPLVKVSADTVFPGDKQFNSEACYQAKLVPGVNPPSNIMSLGDFTDSRWFTLVSAEEVDCQ